MLKHTHHIIPKHIGGSDNSDNLIELTVSDHAEAHRQLWEKHGRWQDYLAWQGLSGRMDKEDIIREKIRLANTGRSNVNKGKKLSPRSIETRNKISKAMLDKKIKHIGRKNGSPTPETKRKISESLIKSGHKPSKDAIVKSVVARQLKAKVKIKTVHRNSKSLFFKEKYYESMVMCVKETGITKYFILKDSSFKWV